MKDHPSTSHSNVASSRKAPQASPNDGNSYNLQCDSSFSDDNDWDTGKLVIDLDVDTSKSPQKSVSVTPKKSAVVALTRSPIKSSVGVGHSMEHHATVDKGLKMKIKRKNAGAKSDTKGHEIVRTEKTGLAGLAEAIQQQNPTVNLEKMKTTSACDSSKDKGPKNRANQKDKKMTKDRSAKQNADSGLANGSVFPVSSGAGPSHCNNLSVNSTDNSSVTESERDSKGAGNTPDPYEFNAKVEDRVGVPRMKKIKVEKTDAPSSIGMKDIGVETCSQGAMTDPDCLGPCEPGTHVTLEGIVWQENENGMLVVNVTWRGKTFVGTLLDATKHDWAPPRLGCDSPTNELDTRTPKGRGKRGRGNNQVPLNDVSNTTDRRLRKGRRRNSGANTTAPTFTAPSSPAKPENTSLKRKGRPNEPDLEAAKKSRTCSNTRSTPTNSAQDELIECPEPNCSKKYRHINGLRYHQSHAHQNSIDDNGDIIKEEKMDLSPSASEKEECDTSNNKEETVAKSKDVEKDNVKEKEKSKSEKSGKGKGKKSSKQDKESNKSVKTEESDSNNSNVKPTGAQGKLSSQTEVAKASSTAEVKKTAVSSTDCKSNSDSNNKAVTDNKSVPDKSHSDTKIISSSSSSSEIVKAVETITTQADILKSSVTQSVISSSPGLSVSSKKQHITYQISGPAAIGCVGGITVVSGSGQTVGTNIGAITSKVGPLGVGSNITTVSVPVATVVTATTVDIPKADDKMKKTKTEKAEKVKTKGTSANRPIVPAPMTVAQGGITAVSTHTQMSPITTTTSTLKPIQPKPTIMGETTSINPALSSLKDKKPKKKKSKDKEAKDLPKDLSSKTVVSNVLQVPSHSVVKDSLPKPESLSVIKSAPATSLVTPPRVITEVVKPDAARDILPGRSLLAPASVKDRHEEPPLLVQHQLHPQSAASSKPPGSLSLKSPQPTPDESTDREANTSDVHSPAYSDISDANDSAPTLESESDLDRNIKTEPQGQNDGVNMDKNQDQNLARGYGMYPYYSQPPYLVPAVQPSPNNKTGDNGSNTIKDTPKKPETPNTEQKQGQPRKDMEPRELNTGSPLGAVTKTSRSAAPSPQQSPADIQRMQAAQAHMYQQYQYMYNCNPEQAYHMTMLHSDANYRAHYEKYVKENQRGPVEKEGDKRGDKPRQVSEAVSRPPSEHQAREGAHKTAEGKPENKPPALISDRERLERERTEKERQQALQREREMEQNLKEKQNENHQIMKENIELKAQMDNRHRFEYQRHPEDLFRYQMLQQKHRAEEMKPLDARKHPEPNPKEVPSKDKGDLRQDFARTRSPSTGPQQAPKDLSSPKPGVDKSRHEDKIPTASPRSTPKPKDGVNIPSSVAYSQYMQHPAYYPAQVPYEAGHPMYRGVSPIIGFAGPAPAYNIHPSQVRYVSPNEPNVEKEKIAISPNTPVSEAQSKEPLQAHGPSYYGAGQPHKIHELKDVGKPGEHPSPAKGTEQERQPSPFNKSSSEHSNSPPTQRHLHSHHHTHVVTPGYPSVIYDPYNDHARLGRQSGMSGVDQMQAFIGQPGPHAGMPPHYVPK